ncbi:hypothetical protein [Kitasatospora sp. NPDC127067]|uniref:hypothetical protein n=1 Tax=unclassified Kitasatospora TaxID=2633591 RepID=UPI0036677DD9
MLLTGSPPSPALHLVAATLGEAEVRRRLDAGADGLNTGWYVEGRTHDVCPPFDVRGSGDRI